MWREDTVGSVSRDPEINNDCSVSGNEEHFKTKLNEVLKQCPAKFREEKVFISKWIKKNLIN